MSAKHPTTHFIHRGDLVSIEGKLHHIVDIYFGVVDGVALAAFKVSDQETGEVTTAFAAELEIPA